MKRRQLSEWAFRITEGHWCPHYLEGTHEGVTRRWDTWAPWRIADGMRKWRWCRRCNRTEWV